jgi:hypothetical protein
MLERFEWPGRKTRLFVFWAHEPTLRKSPLFQWPQRQPQKETKN